MAESALIAIEPAVWPQHEDWIPVFVDPDLPPMPCRKGDLELHHEAEANETLQRVLRVWADDSGAPRGVDQTELNNARLHAARAAWRVGDRERAAELARLACDHGLCPEDGRAFADEGAQ